MLQFAANLSMLFADRPLAERFAAAGAAGFSAVEIQFPYALPKQQIRAELERGELVPAIDCQPLAGGESYYLAWSGRMSNHAPLTAFRLWLADQTRRFVEEED